MSAPILSRIVEWSPNEVVGFDAGTKQYVRAASFGDLAGKFPTGPIVVAVSRRSSFVKALRVPNASASEVNLILQTQMTSMFPVPLHELAYSFRLSDDINEEGRLAIVAAIRESDLIRLQTEAKEAGFRAERILPAAFGSIALAESLDIKDAAVVQETGEGLGIDLLSGGELRYSRVAPTPANQSLTESEIARSFQAVGLPESSVIAAGGFALGSAANKSNTTSLEALLSAPLDRMGINLETREAVAKRDKAKQANRSRLAVLLCASAALLALLVYVDWADGAEARRITDAKWAKILKDEREKIKKLEADLTKLTATSDSLKRALAPAQLPGDVYTVISNHAPKGLWLTGTTYERGKIMYIRGTSSSNDGVSAYLEALNAEPRLRDVKLVFANNGEIEKTPVVQFSIQAFPVGNLPLIDPKKKGARKS